MTINQSLNKYIGARIKERRQKLNLTLYELSHKLNVSHQQLHKYERGITSTPIQILYKLSKIFCLSTNYFYQDAPRIEQQIFKIEHSSQINADQSLPFERSKHLDLMIIEPDPKDEFMIWSALNTSIIKTNPISFHNGLEALKFLKNPVSLIQFPKPELIFLEINLPRDEGEFFLKSIKRNSNLKDIPIIIITNAIKYNHLISCYQNQVAGFLQKTQTSPSFSHSVHLILTYWSQIMSLPNMSADSL